MGRRLTALAGMLLLVGLALVLIWRVYLHHTYANSTDETTVVSISGTVL